MLQAVLVAISLGFFALSVANAVGCDRVKRAAENRQAGWALLTSMSRDLKAPLAAVAGSA